MSEVNLDQDPAEFAALATNDEPADPEGQPTVQKPAVEKPAEVTPEEDPVTPEDPEEEPEQKTLEVTDPEDSKEQPTEQTSEEKQALEATQKITELGQENKKRFDSMVAVVRGNPDSIKAIHDSDPEIADKIANELWGSDSYDDLMKQSEIEELKEKDPEGAKNAGRIYELEKENEKTQKRLRKSDEDTFFTAKGIINNEFDPKYKTLMESMEKVNPDLIKEDYPEALKFAYSVAFPARTTAEIEADQKAILLAKGTGTQKSGGISPSNQKEPASTIEPEAQEFMNAVGA